MILICMILVIVGFLIEWMLIVRLIVLEKNRVCFICLRIGYIFKSCLDKKGCEYCSKMYYLILY